ncbi:hypothetical protein NWE55_02215 [Myroides albus]|uniref:hypothetical protein n=1 Tax=Myroides albus TaxID=2562892 RepID=UPI002158A9E8|nr:hypothetical protein [Myroides albus]UVD80128.1 hypothetical protein NWE55_02215 [Myroides albus]
MKYIQLITIFTLVFIFNSCKTNQKVGGEKVGRWIFKNTVEGQVEIHKGRFNKDGFQKGTWRYKRNGKLYKKEEFHDSVSFTTYYYPNSKIESFGKTVFIENNEGLHYYYTGSWFIYDIKGKLIQVKHYNKGILEHIVTVKK